MLHKLTHKDGATINRLPKGCVATTDSLDASYAVQNYDGEFVIPSGEARAVNAQTFYKVTIVVDGITSTIIERTYYETACRLKYKYRNYTPKVIPL